MSNRSASPAPSSETGRDAVADAMRDSTAGEGTVRPATDAAREASHAWSALGRLGLVDMIFNHISVSFFEDGTRGFVTNPIRRLACRSRADEMLRVVNGHAPPDANDDGLLLHSALQEALPHPRTCIHLHSRSAVMVSSLSVEIEPVSVAAMEFVGPLTRIPFSGLLREGVPQLDALIKGVASEGVVLLENHGFVVGASTTAEAVYLCHYFELACHQTLEFLTLRAAAGNRPKLPDADIVRRTRRELAQDRPGAAALLFGALLDIGAGA